MRWTDKQWDQNFLSELMKMKGADDSIVDRQVWRVLLRMRTRVAIEPYLKLFKLAWELINGKYWRSAKKIHSGPDQAPSAGTGAGSFTVPVSQFTSYPGGFTGSTAAAGAGFSVGTAPVPFGDAGIKAGEVTAYRCWKLGDDGMLHSVVYNDFVWRPGEIAEGKPEDGNAGIYAYKSVLDLHNYGTPDKISVTGTVDLWGEVYEHQHGYRAQYAAIASIDDSPHYDAAALRKRYKLTRKRQKK